MAEIAQRLGVAASSVSRALRDDPRIGADLRRRVRACAAALGYRPHPLVSALMANRRRRCGIRDGNGTGEGSVIALVTDYPGGEDWRAKDVCRWEFEGVRRRADELGFRVEVFPLPDYGRDPARLEATLRARGIRGVLLGFSRGEEEKRQGGPSVPCCAGGFAVAGLSAYFRAAVVDRANFHGFFNVQLALDEMWRLGWRRPALVVPERNNRISNNHWSGAFLDWQRRLPKADRCEPLIPTGTLRPAEFDAWLEANRPDSLLVYKVPVRALLARRGHRVPDEIGLAYLYRTSDEMGAAAGIDGNLAVVGAAALDLVVEKLNANRLDPPGGRPKEVLIQGTWCGGATLPTRPVPVTTTVAPATVIPRRPARTSRAPRPSRARRTPSAPW